MNKQIPLIPIEEGYVAVSTDHCEKGDFYYNPVEKVIKQATSGKVNTNKIIAHTGISSLKNSGLPLMEIPDNDSQQLSTDAWNNLPDEDRQELQAHSYIEGWKDHYKIGGYTEKDMINAFFAGREWTTRFQEYKWNDALEYLQSFKKHPVAVVIEMQHPFDNIDNIHVGKSVAKLIEEMFEPKIIDNKVIVEEVIYE